MQKPTVLRLNDPHTIARNTVLYSQSLPGYPQEELRVGLRIRCELYTTLILEYLTESNTLRLTTGGYPTETTKRRMNLALRLLRIDGRVFAKHHRWYLSYKDADIPFDGSLDVGATQSVLIEL